MASGEVDIGDLLRWSEALAGCARTGLGFSASMFERERFAEILAIAADIRFAADERAAGENTANRSVEPQAIVEEWMRSVRPGIDGYHTPRVAIGALVGNDRDELLLVQRADSGVWLYPTGWADVGYSATEVAVKEVAEETGLLVEPVRLAMVIDGLRAGISRFPLYSLVFHCRLLGGTLHAHPLECADVGFFSENDLPSPLARRGNWIERAFSAIRGEAVEVIVDQPRGPVWRGKSSAGAASS